MSINNESDAALISVGESGVFVTLAAGSPWTRANENQVCKCIRVHNAPFFGKALDARFPDSDTAANVHFTSTGLVGGSDDTLVPGDWVGQWRSVAAALGSGSVKLFIVG
jgi:hypothetical protein